MSQIAVLGAEKYISMHIDIIGISFYHGSTPNIKVGMSKGKMRCINGIDKAVLTCTPRLHMTCPSFSQSFDIVVMWNIRCLDISHLRNLRMNYKKY